MNRRKFVTRGTAGMAAMLVSSASIGKSAPGIREAAAPVTSGPQRYDLMKEVMKYRKIDTHAHIYWTDDSPETQLDYGRRLGIEKQVISRYLDVMPGTPDQFRKFNDLTIKAIKKYPDHLLGGFVLNPVYKQESLDEIKRCTDAGMIGTGELYYQVKINDPKYFPIIEKLIDLKMIIHSHGECQLGVGGYRMKYNGYKQPNTSIPEDFVDIARRYPEGIFQYAHIGMGGDWEYECKLFRDYPNIYVDTSGSNNAENMIDFAVSHLGEDRLFFASDNSYYQSVGKILAANLTERQKQKIFFDNYNNLLKKGGRGVD
ncbi:amidohydrolase family protein [Niabella soli]|uniref:Amidohydrolase n=1 Tax=Niabella soli DSM 19437 TaxID=929713 RepID=W0EUQ7_9BACT|nr:amidohydrolase family protein [Niabella soli]AHF14517.1 amidohydrolase [Niabella soli DSM 19437]